MGILHFIFSVIGGIIGLVFGLIGTVIGIVFGGVGLAIGLAVILLVRIFLAPFILLLKVIF